jgi:PAS domain S-box-containing protein
MSEERPSDGLAPRSGQRYGDPRGSQEPTAHGGRSFREIFAESTVPMLLADDERRFLEANDAACRLLDLPLEEVRRLRLDDLAPPEARPFLDDQWRSFLEERSRAGHYEFLLPDGRRMEFDYSATADVEPGRHLAILVAVDAEDSPAASSRQSPAAATLTAREREVISLLALGATGEEIAEQLNISPDTVRNHVRSAREKLGAKTRAQAIALALLNGEIAV